jgi:hypothetical protein
MNIIVNRARQKILITGYYIGEDRLYRKSMTHSRRQGERMPSELSYFEHCS